MSNEPDSFTYDEDEDDIIFICYPTKCVYCDKDTIEMSDDGNRHQTCEKCGDFFAPLFYTIVDGEPVLKTLFTHE